MLKHIKRHVLSLEDNLDTTMSPELAEANAAEIIEGDKRNEEILQAKDDIIANATKQAEEPFNPDVVDSDKTEPTEELSDTTDVNTVPDTEDDFKDAVEETTESEEVEEDLIEDVEDEAEEVGSVDEDIVEDADPETEEDGAGEGSEEDNEGLDDDLEEEDTTDEPVTESDDLDSDESDEVDEDDESEDDEAEETEAEEEESDEVDDEIEIEDVDLATTDEDVEDAEAESDEAEDEADEDKEELIDDSKTLDEIESETESLESYIGLLKEGIRTGAKDPLFMAAVDIKLQKFKSSLGTLAPRTPSLEHYSVDEATEYYSFALEAAEGVLGRIKSLGSSLAKSIDNKYQAMLVKRTTPRNNMLNKKADLMIAKLAAVKDNPTVTVKSLGFRTTESSLAKAVTTDLKNLTLLSGERIGKVSDIYTEVVSIFQAIKTSGGPGKTGKIAKRGFKVKPLKFDEFSKPGTFITGHYLTAAEPVVDGDNEMHQLRELFSGLVPSLELDRVKGSVDSFSVTKTELLRLATLTKAYIALSNKTLNTIGTKVTEIQSKLNQDLVAILDEDFARFNIDDESLGREGWQELVIPHGIVAGVTDMTKHYVRLYNFTVVHGSEVAERLLAMIDSAVKRMK